VAAILNGSFGSLQAEAAVVKEGAGVAVGAEAAGVVLLIELATNLEARGESELLPFRRSEVCGGVILSRSHYQALL